MRISDWSSDLCSSDLEYRRKPALLADYLPWAALVAPGVVLNKDGSFQRTFRFRGPDLESATEAELVATCARLNNVLRRFGSGWALFFEAERDEAPGYPLSTFPDAATWLVDHERRGLFEAGSGDFDTALGSRHQEHFASPSQLTPLFLPPPAQFNRPSRAPPQAPPAHLRPHYPTHTQADIPPTHRAH